MAKKPASHGRVELVNTFQATRRADVILSRTRISLAECTLNTMSMETVIAKSAYN
jgi:hypothetical protein